MSPRLLAPFICGWLLVASAPAAPAAPPEKLEWNDLLNHPERWPQTCTLTKKIRYGPRDSLNAGTPCRVVAVMGAQA